MDEAVNDFGFILYKTKSGSPPSKFYYKESLNSINNDPENTGFKDWTSTCQTNGCTISQTCHNPASSSCDIETNASSPDSKSKANAIKRIIQVIYLLYSNSDYLQYTHKLSDLASDYDQFIQSYKVVLGTAKSIINSITSIISDYIGTGGSFFNIVNCKFIGKNLKVVLYNLKSSLGGDVKTVGICLSVIGCSIALSIASTLILIEIINVIENNKQPKKNGEIINVIENNKQPKKKREIINDIENNKQSKKNQHIPENSVDSALKVFKYNRRKSKKF